MTYAKPNIVVLGAAIHLIESSLNKAAPVVIEFLGRRGLSPAYDLDE